MKSVFCIKHRGSCRSPYLLAFFPSVWYFPSTSDSLRSSVGLWGSDLGNAVFRVSTMALTTICKSQKCCQLLNIFLFLEYKFRVFRLALCFLLKISGSLRWALTLPSFPGKLSPATQTAFEHFSYCCSSHICRHWSPRGMSRCSCKWFRKPVSHFSTLSILETTKGFLTKAILASVFRARNSCTSSLFAISGTAHNCCKERCSFRSFLGQLPSLIT